MRGSRGHRENASRTFAANEVARFMIFIAGVGIAVFIEILLLSKKQKSGADKILLLWIFLMGLHLFLFQGVVSKSSYEYPFLLGIEQPFPLLHGVLLYFYVASATGQLPANRKWLWLHFVPAMAAYTYLLSFFFIPEADKIATYENKGAPYDTFMLLLRLGVQVSGVAYVVLASVLLKRHRKRIQEEFSDLAKVNLQWLQILTWGLGGIWFLVVFIQNDLLIFSSLTLFILLIGFFGVRQQTVFVQESLEDNTPKEAAKKKYSKSGLKDKASEAIWERLSALMEAENLHRQDLTIADLAAQLGVASNHLSQVINEKHGMNFYDFINFYRVEDFKAQIAQPENQKLTLLSVAYDCGFNSKSSFNRHFKKVTGQTPSQYYADLMGSKSEG